MYLKMDLFLLFLLSCPSNLSPTNLLSSKAMIQTNQETLPKQSLQTKCLVPLLIILNKTTVYISTSEALLSVDVLHFHHLLLLFFLQLLLRMTFGYICTFLDINIPWWTFWFSSPNYFRARHTQ